MIYGCVLIKFIIHILHQKQTLSVSQKMNPPPLRTSVSHIQFQPHSYVGQKLLGMHTF